MYCTLCTRRLVFADGTSLSLQHSPPLWASLTSFAPSSLGHEAVHAALVKAKICFSIDMAAVRHQDFVDKYSTMAAKLLQRRIWVAPHPAKRRLLGLYEEGVCPNVVMVVLCRIE